VAAVRAGFVTLNDQIDRYFELRKQILEAFGYQEEWRHYPIDDCRGDYWMLTKSGSIVVHSPEPFTEKSISSGSAIYVGHRHHKEHIWRKPSLGLTLTHVDTQYGGNIFLSIFSNDKEENNPDLIKFYEEHW
jgi:hypothetical protein